MIIHYDNLLDRDDCGMYSASEHPRYPLKNLLDDKLCLFSKLYSGDASIVFSFGESVSADSFGIAGYTDTEFVLEASDSATFSTTKLRKEISANIIDGVYHPTTVYFDSVTAQYWRVSVSGSAAHRIGKIFLGPKYIAPAMEAKQQNMDLNIPGTQTFTGTGQAYTQKKYFFQTCKIQTAPISHEQRLSIVKFLRSVGKHKSVFVLIWNKQQGFVPAIYGILDADKISFPRSDSATKPFKCEIPFREIF